MKLALVTQRIVVDGASGEVRDALDQRWARFLVEVGVVAVPVPSGVAPDALVQAVGERVAMVVLTGGGDVGAEHERARDDVERRLIELLPRTPVIGVCRGAQQLCVLDGWRLAASAGHVGTPHRLRAHGAFARHDGLVVSSFHRLAPHGGGTALRPTAFTDDGTIEGLESDDGKRTALLWHPERHEPFLDADVQLFRERLA